MACKGESSLWASAKLCVTVVKHHADSSVRLPTADYTADYRGITVEESVTSRFSTVVRSQVPRGTEMHRNMAIL
jgi:hypothetical protein